MPIYHIEIPEIHKLRLTVKARSAKEALKQASSMIEEGVDVKAEYEETLPQDEWSVTKER